MEELKQTWDKAPNDDVQFIIIYNNTLDAMGRHTRHTMTGEDYYFFDGGTFGSSFNNIDVCFGTILYGRWVDDKIYELITQQAMDDYKI